MSFVLDTGRRDPCEQYDHLYDEAEMVGTRLDLCLSSLNLNDGSGIFGFNLGQMVDFVDCWVRQNSHWIVSCSSEEDIFYEGEGGDESLELTLPWKVLEECPLHPFERLIKDSIGRKRCGYFGKTRAKGGQAVEQCYDVVNDVGTVLSLESVLGRLNLRDDQVRGYCGDASKNINPCERQGELRVSQLREAGYSCPGHIDVNQTVEFEGGSRVLAGYVRLWYEQMPENELPPVDD